MSVFTVWCKCSCQRRISVTVETDNKVYLPSFSCWKMVEYKDNLQDADSPTRLWTQLKREQNNILVNRFESPDFGFTRMIREVIWEGGHVLLLLLLHAFRAAVVVRVMKHYKVYCKNTLMAVSSAWNRSVASGQSHSEMDVGELLFMAAVWGQCTNPGAGRCT